jgi:hypothetical protein
MRPDDADLRETVERMETRLRTHPLFPAYEQVSKRFAAWRTNATSFSHAQPS